jgi:Xaa-Pro aminopeptidase
MLSQEFLRHNRHLLRSSLQGELIILAANGLLQRSGDTVYPFRQDSNFYYLTGIEQPDVLLVINGKSEFLVLPKQSKAEMILVECLIWIYSKANREYRKFYSIQTVFQK